MKGFFKWIVSVFKSKKKECSCDDCTCKISPEAERFALLETMELLRNINTPEETIKEIMGDSYYKAINNAGE